MTAEEGKRRYHERRRKGECTRCGDTPLSTLTLCEPCRQSEAKRYRVYCKKHPERRTHRTRTKNGECTRCQSPDLKTKHLCGYCSNLANEQRRERYQIRIEKGLCAKCGKQPAAEGESWKGEPLRHCDSCLDKQIEYYQAYRDKKRKAKQDRQNALFDEGLCLGCAKPFTEAGAISKSTGEPYTRCRPCSGKLSFFQKDKREYGEKGSIYGGW